MNDWMVEGLFRRGEICMLVADAHVGKTYFLLNLLYSMVTGTRWLGHFDCFTGPVYFLGGDVSKRSRLECRFINTLLGHDTDLQQFREQYGRRFVMRTPVRMPGNGAPLTDPRWWAQLRKTLAEIPKEARQKLWIFDPIMALMDNCDKGEFVKPFVDNCRWLADFTDGCVVLGHHFKKKQGGGGGGNDHSDRIHGPTMFRNLVDNIMVLENDPDAPQLVHVYLNKLKDAAGGGGGGKPAFHVFKRFDLVSYPEIRAARRALGGEPHGREEPNSIVRAIWRYVAYNRDFDPTCREPEATPKAALELTPDCTDPQSAETHLRVVTEDECPPDIEPQLTELQGQVLSLLKLATKPVSKGSIHKSTGASKRRIDSAIAELLALRLITEHAFDTGWGVGYLASQ